MGSRFDDSLADDWERAYTEFQQTVVRRIRGDSARTEDVTGIVQLDDESGGWVDGPDGQRVETSGFLEIAAGQENTSDDTWVIDGVVYPQIGEATGSDGGSKTVVLRHVKGKLARRVRTSGR